MKKIWSLFRRKQNAHVAPASGMTENEVSVKSVDSKPENVTPVKSTGSTLSNLEIKKEREKAFREEIICSYGEPSNEFCFKNKRGYYLMALVFENSKLIIMLSDCEVYGKIPFASILDYSINQDEITNNGGLVSVTTSRTSTGSMVKRGVAGGLLLGGVGAIIGASTAKTESTTKSYSKEVKYKYSIDLNINSLKIPVYSFDFDSNEDECNKAAGLFSVILNRTKGEPLETAEISLEIPKLVERDPLFNEVARYVVSSFRCSESHVQRIYGIGYVRACNIVDQLEQLGIIGSSPRNKPRAVLVDPSRLEKILATLE